MDQGNDDRNDGFPFEIRQAKKGQGVQTVGRAGSLSEAKEMIVSHLTKEGLFQIVDHRGHKRKIHYPRIIIEL